MVEVGGERGGGWGGGGNGYILTMSDDGCYFAVPRAYLRRPRDTSVFDRGTVCSDGLYSESLNLQFILHGTL